MSQRSTKVRPCPFPATQPSALAPLGAVGLPRAWPTGWKQAESTKGRHRLRKQLRQGPEAWAPSAGLLQPSTCDPSPWGPGSAAMLLERKTPSAGRIAQSLEGET